jgi:hypothetical protein
LTADEKSHHNWIQEAWHIFSNQTGHVQKRLVNGVVRTWFFAGIPHVQNECITQLNTWRPLRAQAEAKVNIFKVAEKRLVKASDSFKGLPPINRSRRARR